MHRVGENCGNVLRCLPHVIILSQIGIGGSIRIHPLLGVSIGCRADPVSLLEILRLGFAPLKAIGLLEEGLSSPIQLGNIGVYFAEHPNVLLYHPMHLKLDASPLDMVDIGYPMSVYLYESLKLGDCLEYSLANPYLAMVHVLHGLLHYLHWIDTVSFG